MRVTIWRSVYLGMLALLLTGILGSVVAAAPAQKDPPGLPNYHEVGPGIYRGGAPTWQGLKTLQAKKVKTIIDLRIEKKLWPAAKKRATAMGFTWMHLPMGREAPTRKQVDTLLDALANAEKSPVYVHCQHGADRTGCMIGIYRVQVQGWTFDQAWAEMRKYGFKPYLDELKAAVRERVQQ